MAFPSFLKQDKDRVLFNQEGELVYHIQEKFFENGCAVIIGEHVSLIGIFSTAACRLSTILIIS